MVAISIPFILVRASSVNNIVGYDYRILHSKVTVIYECAVVINTHA